MQVIRDDNGGNSGCVVMAILVALATLYLLIRWVLQTVVEVPVPALLLLGLV